MLLRGFLFARFDGHVVADRASGDRAKDGVMMREMAGNAADYGALQATGLRRRRGSDEDCKAGTQRKTVHRRLPDCPAHLT